MATYKEIKGRKVQTFSSDPPAPTEGQVWYNSTSALFKVAGTGLSPLGSWSATGAMGTARYGGQSVGSQTAALSMGGGIAPGASTGITEKYNGATWSAVNSLVGPRTYNFTAAGTSTSALAAGGNSNPPDNNLTTTETWNNTCWSTSPSTISPARSGTAGAGTKTSALSWCGYSTTRLTVTQIWNDTSWSTSPATISPARSGSQGTGTKTAALSIGGKTAPGTAGFTNTCLLWNDTSWAATGSMSAPRNEIAGAGTSTLALAIGGFSHPAATAACERFTGSSWAADTALETVTKGGMGCGTLTTAGGIVFSGGQTPAPATVNTAFQWNVGLAVTTITQS